jgi:hypothetical protein
MSISIYHHYNLPKNMISSETRNEHDFHLPVSEDYHGLWAIEDTKKCKEREITVCNQLM